MTLRKPPRAARAGALHPPRHAEDPDRLAAVPDRPRRLALRSRDRLVPLDREPELLPLAPRAGVEPPLSAAQERGGGARRRRSRPSRSRRRARLRVAPGAARPRARCRRPGPGRGSGRSGSARRASARAGVRPRSRARRGVAPARRARSCRPSRSRGTNSAGSICSSPARSGPSQPSSSSTAQSSWPKWRSSHHSRSAPPMFPYATTKTPSPIPAREAACAKSSAAGSGWRPPGPGGAARSASTSRNEAPGMCPAR